MTTAKNLALDRAEACLRGLLYYLPKKSSVYDIGVTLYIDEATVRRNRKSPRAMACASFNGKVARIGICPNLSNVASSCQVGVLLHELTHLAYGLIGGRDAEVDTDATILHVVPESGYHYDDCRYEDWKTSAMRTAKNIQVVNPDFTINCMGWFAGKCPEGKVVVQWTKKKT